MFAAVQALLDIGGKVGQELLGKGAGPAGDGARRGRIESGNEGEEGAEDVGWGVRRLLAANRVEAVSCELAELVEDGLGGGFVANRDADIIDVEEVREAGEVTGAEDVAEDVGGFSGVESEGMGWVTSVDGRSSGAKSLGEGSGGLKEGKVAIIIGKGGASRDAGAHAGGNGRVSGGSGGGIGGVGIGVGVGG